VCVETLVASDDAVELGMPAVIGNGVRDVRWWTYGVVRYVVKVRGTPARNMQSPC
jgi:hypothetical protein